MGEKKWDINQKIREYVSENSDWAHSDLARELYKFTDLINDEFFEGKLPAPVFSFVRCSPTTMGYYLNGPNPIGIYDQINFNPVHISADKASLLDTLAHELTHCWQRNFGAGGKGNYHNSELRTKMAAIGTPCDTKGRSTGMGERFVEFLGDHGVRAKPGKVTQPREVPRPKPTRICWSCGCTSIWTKAGVKLNAICANSDCGNKFEEL